MTRPATRALGILLSLATVVAPGLAAAQKPGASRPDDIGKELRENFLRQPMQEWGIARTPEYPAVGAVATDYAIDDKIVTVVSLADGSSSLYSTTTFFIIGGGGNASTHRAAQRVVAIAQPLFGDATPATTFPYPTGTKVRFYSRGYDDVRWVEADYAALEAGDRLTPLFAAVQDLVSALLANKPALP
jgi:hypothetical protein